MIRLKAMLPTKPAQTLTRPLDHRHDLYPPRMTPPKHRILHLLRALLALRRWGRREGDELSAFGLGYELTVAIRRAMETLSAQNREHV